MKIMRYKRKNDSKKISNLLQNPILNHHNKINNNNSSNNNNNKIYNNHYLKHVLNVLNMVIYWLVTFVLDYIT
jgi:hypothetical protein